MRRLSLGLGLALVAGGCAPSGLEAPPPADESPRTTPVRSSDFESLRRGSCGEREASLFRGARANDDLVVRACVEQGVAVDSLDARGLTALGVASGAGALAAMAVLLEADASVEPVAAGEYPLALAVRNQRLDAARILLEAGARPYAKDGASLLAFAVQSRNRQLAILVLDHGADPEGDRDSLWSPLHSAVAACDEELVERLLEAGADPLRPPALGRASAAPGDDSRCAQVDRLLARATAPAFPWQPGGPEPAAAPPTTQPKPPPGILDLLLPPD